MNPTLPLKLRIEGMDCASCALKIENAIKRLPGVADISVSYAQQSLTLTVEQDRTSVVEIENTVRSLGFTPVGDGHGEPARAALSSGFARTRWWRTRNAALVAAIGALFIAAALVAHLAPAVARSAWTVAAAVALVPFVRRAYAGIVTGTPFSIETLMSAAALGALLIGAAQEAAAVVLLFALGEMLERAAAGHARAGIEALVALVPRDALRERDGKLERVPSDALAVGDIVVVRPGDRIPADGNVIEGAAEVDEAPVTGESVPAAKGPGSAVYAGSVSTDGELRIDVQRAAADNTIARIVHAVEVAQESKAPTARLIDRFSRRYTPAAIAIALFVATVPPLAFGAPWQTWIYRGLGTLLIACPCALVISTPAAIASGLAALARRGLLVKGGAALETLARVRTVAFDKTGTLTAGRPQVTSVIALAGTPDDVLANAAAVERKTSHPLGTAIVAAAVERGLELPMSFGAALTVPGSAITARLKAGFVSVGSPRYAAAHALVDDAVAAQVHALEQQGNTVVVVLAGKRVQGLIALRDEPRSDAKRALDALRRMRIDTIVLTGDNRRAADAIGAALGVRAIAELLPHAKLAEIAQLRERGAVAMVGDGINDAPALAAASVGIAMGSGTDVALETAEAALLRDDVSGVVELLAGAKATLANIWQNVALALALKAVFLCTTLAGVTSLWMAIFADTGATVLVTANALRLLRRGAPRARHRSRGK